MKISRSILACFCLLCAPALSGAQKSTQPVPPEPISLDATLPAPPVETDFLHMGGVSPDGHRINVNSRYLTYDGKPWLPVMGEFHFSRYPQKYWEEELLKMKAGGIQVVATYVFWIHHEEVEGQFDWTGQRDLHQFVALCARHHLYVYLRIGPWDHGEARNGGFPDWLVQKKIALRRNDPEYLKYVIKWYDQIGMQTRDQLFQQGGPIIGVQLENEYGETGPGAGAEHLAKLRSLAINAGIAPPLFSITGWPRNDFPSHDLIPVFGGYPDDFWTGNLADDPPNPVYMFKTDNSAAMAPAGTSGRMDFRHYPSFGAEFGGGMETSYQRRPLIQPEDIAALTLTQVGSGTNLFGYYMFHGGTNPTGKLSTLQESVATNYPNDLPVLNYDFQAPLGEYGQVRPSLDKIKLIHFFLSSFGETLAPMTVYLPAVKPSSNADASVPRIALRAQDDHGFLFVNNYVRKLEMPERKAFQTLIRFRSSLIKVPQTPINLPADSAFVLPVNLNLGAAMLRYSTVQLITRVESKDEPTYFFFAIPGLRPELAIVSSPSITVHPSSGNVITQAGLVLADGFIPGRDCAIHIAGPNGKARIVVLTQQEAESLWLVPNARGENVPVLSEASVFAEGEDVHLRSTDPAKEHAWIFSVANGSAWKEMSFTIEPRKLPFTLKKIRNADARGAMRMGPYVEFRKNKAPVAPEDADFAKGAAWRLNVAAPSMNGLSDVFLCIHYVGDVARLYSGKTLLADDFYNGRTWEIGINQLPPQSLDTPMELRILPIKRDDPIYIDAKAWADVAVKDQIADVKSIEVLPEYEVVLHLPRD